MEMMEMVQRFPDQLIEAMQIGESAQIRPANDINKIYVTGMGGSGIGADFVSKFIQGHCRVPYLVSKSYEMASFVDKNTIVIASSYSGNTEETLANLNSCIAQGARIICIASGGKVIQLAMDKGFEYVLLPDDWPSPRACLGFSLVAQLFILKKLGFIDDGFKNDLREAIDLLKGESQSIKEKAKHLADSLFNKRAIIYSTDRIEPVAVRFRQQINENAKRLCWHHVIPEMNHNELVGWRENLSNEVVIFLRNSDDYPRNQQRIELTKEIVNHYCGTSIELYSKGNSLICRSLYLVHLTDFATVMLAQLNQVDAVEVKVIDYLKKALSDQI